MIRLSYKNRPAPEMVTIPKFDEPCGDTYSVAATLSGSFLNELDGGSGRAPALTVPGGLGANRARDAWGGSEPAGRPRGPPSPPPCRLRSVSMMPHGFFARSTTPSNHVGHRHREAAGSHALIALRSAPCLCPHLCLGKKSAGRLAEPWCLWAAETGFVARAVCCFSDFLWAPGRLFGRPHRYVRMPARAYYRAGCFVCDPTPGVVQWAKHRPITNRRRRHGAAGVGGS